MSDEHTFIRRLNGPVLILMVMAALGIMVVAWSVIGSSPVTAIGVTVLVAAAALALGLLALRVKLTVRSDGVTVSMLGNSETIPASSITGVSRGPVTGIKEGAGLRFVGQTGRDTGYLVGGETVRIDAAAHSYLVSSDAVEDVITAIEKITARH
ncbi:hypothetical protein B841_10180 [Corynebacterium maris DSM 45190]|uniref:Bacterial Pleckstrin homology domain-containing protein n=1 Tax=Corynebacterium maris DSM 45190 TaxID=1224163 RepID=S5TLF3_9CORY|nr:hypothetical protein [Corynebacterium maris]AGS35508.1 hypothetical protein B841_10180 [Corynebacterium maris DSM 45190]